MGPRDERGRVVRMSLRLRLVAALGALLVAGLAAFSVATYNRYSRSEYNQLDARLKQQFFDAARQVTQNAGVDLDNDGRDGDGDGGGGRDGGPDRLGFSGAYAELRDANGTVANSVEYAGTNPPTLPATLTAEQLLTVGSTDSDTEWRVWVDTFGPRTDYLVVVAAPTTEIQQALSRLVLIEVTFGAVLLVLLTGGSWLILRQGLRPLEHMADTARSINAGDLSLRVAPADGKGEVGSLGLALNSMLGDIEKAFAERDATEQRLRQFLADASHELRTPLTSIRGFAELFRLGTDNAHVDQAVIMRRIEEESTRMKALVEDLLLLARLDQTRPIERAPVDLAVLAADACSDAVAADATRAVTLDAPEPVVVQGDRDHLRQAIANLVTNALKHTPSGTPLEVSTTIDRDRAVLVVRDHGGGLDDEALAHVFDRFWQADAARVGAGAGLGLSIVEAIAHEHGGSVTADNAPGGGARFTIRLPLDA